MILGIVRSVSLFLLKTPVATVYDSSINIYLLSSISRSSFINSGSGSYFFQYNTTITKQVNYSLSNNLYGYYEFAVTSDVDYMNYNIDNNKDKIGFVSGGDIVAVCVSGNYVVSSSAVSTLNQYMNPETNITTLNNNAFFKGAPSDNFFAFELRYFKCESPPGYYCPYSYNNISCVLPIPCSLGSLCLGNNSSTSLYRTKYKTKWPTDTMFDFDNEMLSRQFTTMKSLFKCFFFSNL